MIMTRSVFNIFELSNLIYLKVSLIFKTHKGESGFISTTETHSVSTFCLKKTMKFSNLFKSYFNRIQQQQIGFTLLQILQLLTTSKHQNIYRLKISTTIYRSLVTTVYRELRSNCGPSLTNN